MTPTVAPPTWATSFRYTTRIPHDIVSNRAGLTAWRPHDASHPPQGARASMNTPFRCVTEVIVCNKMPLLLFFRLLEPSLSLLIMGLAFGLCFLSSYSFLPVCPVFICSTSVHVFGRHISSMCKCRKQRRNIDSARTFALSYYLKFRPSLLSLVCNRQPNIYTLRDTKQAMSRPVSSLTISNIYRGWEGEGR